MCFRHCRRIELKNQTRHWRVFSFTRVRPRGLSVHETTISVRHDDGRLVPCGGIAARPCQGSSLSPLTRFSPTKPRSPQADPHRPTVKSPDPPLVCSGYFASVCCHTWALLTQQKPQRVLESLHRATVLNIMLNAGYAGDICQ